MRHAVIAGVVFSVLGVLALAGMLAWVLLRPAYWFSTVAHTAQLQRQVVALQDEVRTLHRQEARTSSREHVQEVYARTVWVFCQGFRATRTYDGSNYTVEVMQSLAQACDKVGVPTAKSSYP